MSDTVAAISGGELPVRPAGSVRERLYPPPAGRWQPVLLAIVAIAFVADGLWASLRHFDLDVAAYAKLGALALAFACAGAFYQTVRDRASLAAMLFGASFLVAFSATFSVLNYFLLTIAGARIDTALAALDRDMGLDWPAMITSLADEPAINNVLRLAYNSVLPQVAALVICLGWRQRPEDIYRFCAALAVSAALAMAIWTAFPSFGAISVYNLPPALAAKLKLALDPDYARELVRLLREGPGRISPGQVKGLIGFPSYHAAMALLVVRYAWPIRGLFWLFLALNVVVLLATPVHGGHHVVDVIAGLALAIGVSVAVDALATSGARRSDAGLLAPQTA